AGFFLSLLQSRSPPRALHSFPTRRSSDLLEHWEAASYYWSENLFRGARELLEPYRPHHAGLDIDSLVRLLETCADVAQAKRKDREGHYKLPPLVLKLD